MLRKILLGTFFLSFNCAFAEPTSVLDRNYTLVDAGKNFLDAISYFPNFLLILACAIGVNGSRGSATTKHAGLAINARHRLQNLFVNAKNADLGG